MIIAITIGVYSLNRTPETPRPLGAVPTLDGVDSPYVKINGHQWWVGRVSMLATSTVLCAIQNPFRATSTIEFAGAEVTARGNVNAANSLVISTSTTAYSSSTTSLLDNYAMGTGQFSVNFLKNSATSTQSATVPNGAPGNLLPGMTTTGGSRYVLGPSEWVTWKLATSTDSGGGTFGTYMTGQCSLNLKKI